MILNRPSLQNLIGKKDLIGAEVGVKAGKNAKDMLEKLDIKKLYLIDDWASAKVYRKEGVLIHLDKFKDKLIILNGKSSKMYVNIEDEELDFVYIDADHRYKGIKNDIKVYYPKVKMGGLVAGHDYFVHKNIGVMEAVDEAFDNVNSAFCIDKPVKLLCKDWWVWKK